jgi:hypothetical protein
MNLKARTPNGRILYSGAQDVRYNVGGKLDDPSIKIYKGMIDLFLADDKKVSHGGFIKNRLGI